MVRTVIAAAIVATFVSGCLFPSFDGMSAGASAKRDDPTSETNATDSTSADGGGGGRSDGDGEARAADSAVATSDAGSAAPPASARVIACGSETCAVGNELCCAHPFSVGCTDGAGASACSDVGGGNVLACDDRDDCGPGEECCFVHGERRATCRTSCGGVVLCRAQGPACAGGKTCTGTVSHPQGFASSFCQ